MKKLIKQGTAVLFLLALQPLLSMLKSKRLMNLKTKMAGLSSNPMVLILTYLMKKD